MRMKETGAGVRTHGVSRRGWRWIAAALLGSLALAGGVGPAVADIPGVLYYSGTGHYYKWVSGSINWSNAKSGAQAYGGYLASVTSDAERVWLDQYIRPGNTTCYLGGTDESVEGTWVWLSGETWAYTYWNTNEPNNAGIENYLMVNTNGTWNDINGSSSMSGYIVEWNVNPNIPPIPADPTSLTAVLGADNVVTLNWTDNSTTEASFDVERKVGITPYSQLVSVGPNTTTYDDAATVAGTEYTYRVKAVNLGGSSNYTNEVTVAIPAIPTGPSAPSDVHQVAGTPSSVTVAWTDNADDENGFEIQRRAGTGSWQYLTTAGADVTQYLDNGLSPDSEYGYRIRSVNGNGASSFVETAASSSANLGVTPIRGDLKDSAKFGKDSVKVTASYAFLEGVSDGQVDPLLEGITLRLGTDASPVVVKLPGLLDGWKQKGSKWTWTSAKGTTPKYKVQVDIENQVVSASVKLTELAVPGANPMRISIAIGDDAGTDRRDWTPKKPGIFQFRQ